MSSNASKTQNFIKSVIKFAVAAGLIAWLIASGRFQFGELLKLMTPFYLIIGFTIAFVSLVSNIARWYILLRGQSFTTDFGDAFRLTFIGNFFNLAMPGGVGGDLIKGYYIIQDNATRKMAAATSVLLDRLIGLFSMTVVGLVAILLNLEFISQKRELVVLAASTTLLCFGFIFMFLTAFSNRAKKIMLHLFSFLPGGRFFKGFYEVLGSYRNQPRFIVYAMLFSLTTQILTVCFFYLVGTAIEPRAITFSSYAFVVPLGLIAMAAPIAPAGIGVGQAAFFVLFNWYLGFETQLGPASVTAYQVVQMIWSLLGAYYYFRRKAPVLVPASS